MNVAGDLIDLFTERRGDSAIVDAAGGVTTFGDVLTEIGRGRRRLAAANLTPRSRLIVQAPKGLPFVSAAIAAAAEGHCIVGIEMAQGDAVYLDRARYVDADAVITTTKVRALQRSDRVRRGAGRLGIDVPPALPLPNIDWDSEAPGSVESRGEVAEIEAEETVFIVFTGGTTARPRGVRLSHRAVRAYLAALAQLPEWPGVRSVIADHPQQVLYGLAHGKTVYLSPARSAARPQHTARLLFEEGVDCYFGAPALWDRILATGLHHTARTWPSAVLLGGAPVSQRMLERLAAALDPSVSIRCLYGMSEAGLIAHISADEKLALLQAGAPGDPVGHPAVDVSVVADGGELLVKTPSLFSGFVGESRFKPDMAFPTGDVGVVGDHGVSLLGRKKNMIVQRGVNLYPEQFEARLLRQQSGDRRTFDEVALVPGGTDRLDDEHFVLFYSSPDTSEPDALAAGRAVLPRGHAPKAATRVDALPRTGRQSKIDRRALAARLPAQSLQAMQDDLFDRLCASLAPGSASRRRAIALRALCRWNLRKAQALPRDPSPPARPIFILGHQRSGTTLLHQALAASPDAAALSVADMVAPHPSGWKAITPALRAAASLTGRPPRSARLTALSDLHKLDLRAPEEEEWLFAALGLSGFLPSAFGASLASGGFDRIRDRSQWDRQTRRALIDTYVAILSAWYLGRRSTSPVRHVAKNPAFGPLVGDLLSAFPDAQFVVALREPQAAIASRLDLVAALHGGELSSRQTATIVTDSLSQLAGLAEQLPEIPPERVHYVTFDALLAAPTDVVASTASNLGLARPTTLPAVRSAKIRQATVGVPTTRDIAKAAPEFVALFEQHHRAAS